MPAWFTKWETTGLLTFEDKMAMENSILQRQLKDAAFLAAQEAKGNKGSELTIDKDIMVLLILKSQTPIGLLL
jgi:cation/acetate symporter